MVKMAKKVLPGHKAYKVSKVAMVKMVTKALLVRKVIRELVA